MATLTSNGNNKPRRDLEISVALGGGGAKGNAHIGVLRFLEHEGFHIRAIAGSSIGGLVACFYAAGFSPDDIETLFAEVDPSKLYQRVSDESSSLLGLSRVGDWLEQNLRNVKFEDLQIPCAVTAVDLRTANEAIVRQGSVRDGILSTIALPGIFPSFMREELELIDGGLLHPVPVAVVRSLAPTLPVVAVALNDPLGAPIHSRRLPIFGNLPRPLATRLASTRFARALDVFLRSVEIEGRQITELSLQVERPEVLIRPMVSHIGVLEPVDVHRVAQLGEEAARLKLPDLVRATTWHASLGRRVFQRPVWQPQDHSQPVTDRNEARPS